MKILGISERHNNNGKRRKNQSSKDHTRLTLYFEDDNGKFKTKRITYFEAFRLKLFTSKTKDQSVEYLICNICDLKQKDIGQNVCNSCGN